jgi:hypothetical protein
MKTLERNEELETVITNDVVLDRLTGDVVYEEVTCASSVTLPKLQLADVATMLNDQMYEDMDAA